MTPEEQAREIERITTTAIDDFAVFAESHQRTVLTKIQSQITALKRTTDGRIKPTAENIKAINKLSKEIESIVISPKYKAKVEGVLTEINSLKITLNTYLLETFGNKFDPNKAVFESIFENAILLTRNTLLESGLEPNVIAGIEKILKDNVTGNMRYKSLLEQLRFFITGDAEHKGMLIGSGKGKMNIKTTLRDGMNQFAANYQQTMAVGLGNEFYLYCCGEVEDSREWCVERVNKYWSEKEIRSWGDDSWQGRNPNTNSSNILVYRGGYNCLHSFIPVSQAIVPKEDIDRAKRLGFI